MILHRHLCLSLLLNSRCLIVEFVDRIHKDTKTLEINWDGQNSLGKNIFVADFIKFNLND